MSEVNILAHMVSEDLRKMNRWLAEINNQEKQADPDSTYIARTEEEFERANGKYGHVYLIPYSVGKTEKVLNILEEQMIADGTLSEYPQEGLTDE